MNRPALWGKSSNEIEVLYVSMTGAGVGSDLSNAGSAWPSAASHHRGTPTIEMKAVIVALQLEGCSPLIWLESEGNGPDGR